MKKRILALVLTFAMAFTFVSVFATDASTVKEAITMYGEDKGLSSTALEAWLTRSINVPLDIQLRTEGGTAWEEGLTVREKSATTISSFDFMATLDMSVVKEKFDDLVGSAKVAINAKGGANTSTLLTELDSTPVTGEFTITIKIPDGLTVPDEYKTDNKDMKGFNDEAKELFTETGRTFSGETATINLAVKSGQTKATLESKIGRTITFTVEGVDVSAFGTYKVEGKLEGTTAIGTDIATVNYSTEPLERVDGVDHNPDKTTAPWASATVVAKKSGGSGSSSSGGTASTVKDYTVSLVVDGKTVDTVKSKDGYVDLDGIVPDEKEDFEFKGWYLDENLTKVAESPLKVTGNIKLYAKYEEAVAEPIVKPEEHMAYITGYTDGTVKPLNNIVREEVAAIFYRLMSEEDLKSVTTDSVSFSDVEAGRWSAEAISALAQSGYVKGRPDGTFAPAEYITRAEFAAIVARFANAQGTVSNFSDVNNHWAKSYIEACAANGYITGYTDGTFMPDKYITRAEAMAIVNRMLGRATDAAGIKAVEDSINKFSDNPENAWYYYIVIEATNSHSFVKDENGAEVWEKIATLSVEK